MTSVRLPKIGTIVRNNDGSYDIGPFPDIGGPFETATAFYEAWAAHAKFPKSRDGIQKSMKNGPVNEVISSIAEFPMKLKTVAGRISSCDSGLFPLWHRDLFHSNIIINQRYRVLGVIDWEGACTVPWELVEYPLFLETVPFPMDASWNYNDSGEPLDENTRRRWRERKEYVEKVAKFEVSEQMDDKLSTTLNNSDFQNLAYAMRVYLDPGKLGFYHKVLEPFDRENV
jgi:Phosphotransferase enzyme family